MIETNVLPQYIYDSHISLNIGKSSNMIFNYDKAKVIDQTNQLSDILPKITVEHKEVYCWFTVQESVNRKASIVIERHLERLIETELNDQWDVNVLLIPINTNGTLDDYLTRIEFYLHPISKRHPIDQFTQIISDSNLLLSQALMIEGLRQFGERYESLYWSQNEWHSSQFQVPLQYNNWYTLFKTFIQDYDYQAALELIKEMNDDSLLPVEYILQSIIKRMNFAFDESYAFIQKALELLPNHDTLEQTAIILKKLLHEDNQIKDLERIVELFRHIDIFIETDDVPSFLVRFYRAREAVLFYLLKYAATSDSHIKSIGKKSSIHLIFEELEELYDNWDIDGYYGAYFFLKSKNTYNILNYRNKSFIGHSRNKIDSTSLWLSFAGTTSTTVAKAKRRFQMDVDLLLRDLGVQADDNFYVLNMLLTKLSARMTKKEGVIE